MTPFDAKYLRIESFNADPNSSEYRLSPVTKEIIEKVKDNIKNIEKCPDVILCSRGDSKLDHSDFINTKLSYQFIVGEKARTHIKELRQPFSQTYSSKDTLQDVKKLVRICNSMLRKWRSKYSDISGEFKKDTIEKLSKTNPKTIEQFKLAILSLLHNKGSDPFFKPSSPYLSFSRGSCKYAISKKFATYRNDTGLVYVYIINKKFENYIYSFELKKLLEKFGVNWFADIHSEVMLLNGMYPHYLLGFFEVSKTRYLRFILNPWFYKVLLENDSYDFSQGVPVNQQNFKTFAYNLGYASYTYNLQGNSNEYLSKLGKLEQREVQRLRNVRGSLL